MKTKLEREKYVIDITLSNLIDEFVKFVSEQEDKEGQLVRGKFDTLQKTWFSFCLMKWKFHKVKKEAFANATEFYIKQLAFERKEGIIVDEKEATQMQIVK